MAPYVSFDRTQALRSLDRAHDIEFQDQVHRISFMLRVLGNDNGFKEPITRSRAHDL